jgi:uncharacterized protein (DUF1330 family)
MTVYALAQLKIRDRARYGRYLAAFMPVLIKYKGRLLVADEAPRVLGGVLDVDKVVILSFADEAALQAWANSPEYIEISKDRDAGADVTIVLVNGVD